MPASTDYARFMPRAIEFTLQEHLIENVIKKFHEVGIVFSNETSASMP
jgi:hypothetical protein